MSIFDDDPQPNVPLMRKVMDQIREHPEEWNQGWWKTTQYTMSGEMCGTAYCFAGWACQLSGAKFLNNDEVVFEDTKREWVGDAARRLLGIDGIDGQRLFRASNSIEDLEHELEVICGEPL